MASRKPTTTLTADEALVRLLAGNQRFCRGDSAIRGLDRDTLERLAAGQAPFATVLGCSDSRVVPETIFDAGLGELFVIRVAGNVFSAEIAGSLQYAGTNLRTPLFVVLGHEGCGAVQAAIDAIHDGAQFASRIQILVNSIAPGLPADMTAEDASGFLSRAVEANVRWTVRQILATPEAQARLQEGSFKIVGAVYDIRTGEVRILQDFMGGKISA